MHLATIGSNSDAGTTPLASLTVPVTTAVASGNRVLVAVESNALAAQDGPFTCTDSKGNTYTTPAAGAVPMHSFKSGTTQISLLESVLSTGLTLSDHLTVAHPAVNVLYWAVTAEAFDDLTGFDTGSAGTGNTGASNSPTPANTPTAAQSTQLVFMVTGWGGSGTPTVPGGWDSSPMIEAAGASNRRLQAQWKYVNVGGARSGSLALSASGSWATILAAYNSAAAPQILLPIADVTTASWVKNGGSGAFYTLVDEVVPDTSDFLRSGSNPVAQPLEFLVAVGSVPTDFTGHKVRAYLRLNGSSGTVTLKFKDLTSVVASSSALPITPGVWDWYDFTLSSGAASGISSGDYDQLHAYLEVTATP